MARVRERLIEWLASKASGYLVWVYEREIAQARAHHPDCPDCSMPEPMCECSSRDTYDSMTDWARL